jgi:GNAT superfamily N-acetyltransferase
MNQDILDTLWRWIHDKNHIIEGICYELEEKIVGIAHFRTMPRPIKGQYIGFLDDLFVNPDYRRKKIAQKIINHLKDLSEEKNWQGIRWITHYSNENAKKLYDKIAINTGFELYELKRD